MMGRARLPAPIAAASPIAFASAIASASAIAIVGCGSAAKPTPPVRLTISSPADGMRTLGRSVSISGTVSPAGSTVLVAGKRVAVSGGSFSTSVAVKPGSNVLDVLASSPRTKGAMGAVRVYRQVLITIPDLGGESPSQASTQLTRLGLVAKMQDGGGFLEPLIPASPQVCQTDPAAGHAVVPGSTVQVRIAKLC